MLSARPLQVSLWLIVLCLPLSGCTVPAQNWKSPFFRDHPLVGKIWDTRQGAWITEQQLHGALLGYDYLLLGESHDNIDHHIVQARLLRSLAVVGAEPVVVMEMLPQEAWSRQPRIWEDFHVLQARAKTYGPGWPWELYAPILKAVVRHRLELVAGNVGGEILHKNVPLNVNERLAEYPIAADDLQQLRQDIETSHCGFASTAQVQSMLSVQLRRDRAMASALMASRSPAVLIAGNGHVRSDYAVPKHLRDGNYLSVALISVLPGWFSPEEYMDKPGLFDVLYFTPSHTDQDACTHFRKQLESLRRDE